MPAPGEFLIPNSWAANMPSQALWWGANMLAPNITSLLTGQPPPPLPNVPEMTPTGKIPSTDDPRIAGAMSEALNTGLTFLPLPGGGLAVDAVRGIPALMGLLRREAASGAESLASKSPMMYNPAIKSPRPFAADYPSGAPADAAGRLTADIEGRPLGARYVVGRKVVGGEDQALSPAEFDPLTEATTGQVAAVVPPRQASFGRTLLHLASGRPVRVEFNAGMQPEKAAMVHAHELGHVVDEMAGQIPAKGLSNELKGVYNTLNNPNRSHPDRNEAASWGKPFTPQALGYKGDEIPREYMAEGIRAYLADPNYIKTVAPKTASAIRAAVNAHPTLSKIIQFNSIAGLPAMSGIDLDTLPIPRQQPLSLPQE